MSKNTKKIIIVSNKDKISSVDLYENNSDTIFADISKKTILHYLKNAVKISLEQNLDYVIILTENHAYTSLYQKLLFEENIKEAANNNCHILCGGLLNFYNAVVVSSSLVWIDRFISSNYLVIFNTLYSDILKLDNLDTIDELNDLTVNKMVVFPFISTYKNTTSNLSSEYKVLLDPYKIRENNSFQKLQLYMNGFKRFNV